MADQHATAGGGGLSGSGNAKLFTGILLCFGSMSSIQFGSAFSATAIDAFGPSTTTFLRLVIASLVLALIVRPPMRSYSREQWKSAILLGATMAAMTLFFFAAIDRIPLGLAVAIEFLGPLAVATWSLGAGWRLIWPLAAFAGVVLLSHDGAGWVGDPMGMLFACGAGVGWGTYIILMKKSGKLFKGLEGLSMSLLVAAVVAAPFGLPRAGEAMDPQGIGMMVGLALLVPLVPYALEMIALRRMPMSAFGILMSLEPALGALAGFLVLSQPMTPLQMLGTALVVAASAGVTSSGKGEDGAGSA